MGNKNVLWLELPELESKTAEEKVEQIALLNKVIHKLGIPEKCSFEEGANGLIYVHPDGTFWECPENGHRFSLDFLAQDVEEDDEEDEERKYSDFWTIHETEADAQLEYDLKDAQPEVSSLTIAPLHAKGVRSSDYPNNGTNEQWVLFWYEIND